MDARCCGCQWVLWVSGSAKGLNGRHVYVGHDMVDQDLRKEAHDVDVTVWVGKAGIESVTDELTDQLQARKLVKVKFLRAARGGTTTEELAEELADAVDAELVETRGNTGVFH